MIRKRVQRMMLTELRGRMNELNKKFKKETDMWLNKTIREERIHLRK